MTGNDNDAAAIEQLVHDLRRVWINVPPRTTTVPLYYPVAELLREELTARGWDVGQFAVAGRMPVDVAQEMLDGARITRLGAEAISKAFPGTSVQFWTNLDRRTRPAS